MKLLDNHRAVPWATSPLHDPENVGRKVWVSWNHNHPSTAVITGFTRTGVLVDIIESPKRAFQVRTVGASIADRNVGQWPSTIFTEQHRLEEGERSELIGLITRGTSYWGVPIGALREIRDIIERES